MSWVVKSMAARARSVSQAVHAKWAHVGSTPAVSAWSDLRSGPTAWDSRLEPTIEQRLGRVAALESRISPSFTSLGVDTSAIARAAVVSESVGVRDLSFPPACLERGLRGCQCSVCSAKR